MIEFVMMLVAMVATGAAVAFDRAARKARQVATALTPTTEGRVSPKLCQALSVTLLLLITLPFWLPLFVPQAMAVPAWQRLKLAEELAGVALAAVGGYRFLIALVLWVALGLPVKLSYKLMLGGVGGLLYLVGLLLGLTVLLAAGVIILHAKESREMGEVFRDTFGKPPSQPAD